MPRRDGTRQKADSILRLARLRGSVTLSEVEEELRIERQVALSIVKEHKHLSFETKEKEEGTGENGGETERGELILFKPPFPSVKDKGTLLRLVSERKPTEGILVSDIQACYEDGKADLVDLDRGGEVVLLEGGKVAFPPLEGEKGSKRLKRLYSMCETMEEKEREEIVPILRLELSRFGKLSWTKPRLRMERDRLG